jgi:hypothetical protein
MSDAYVCIFALLSCFGAAAVLYLFVGEWLRPRQKDPYILLVRPESPEKLLETARHVRWLERRAGMSVRLVVMPPEKDEETLKMTELLARDYDVELMRRDEIGGYFWKNG